MVRRPLVPASIRRYVLLAGLGLVLLAACSHVPHVSHDVIIVPSCFNNARAMSFMLNYTTPFISSLSFEAGSLNLVGAPVIYDLGPGAYQVVAELDNVALGEEVTLAFTANGLEFGSAVVSDVQFFTVPPDQIVDPGCSPGSMPEVALVEHAPQGLEMEASNPSTQPLTLMSLELAESPDVLSISALDWSGPEFNALPWQPAIGTATPLDPAAPPLVIDLPDQVAPDTKAVLCRFISHSGGFQSRNIVEVDLVSGPVRTQASTWGAVKALYR